jgi:hypothetical protein
VSLLYPGNQTSQGYLRPTVAAVERVLGLPRAQRRRTVLRLDGGFGPDANLNWALWHGYQLLAKGYSGTSDLLAGWLQSALNGWSQTLILLTLFAIVAVITQFMSDGVTTALFAPVAIILAQALGHPPEPYVVTVAMAAVASFLTPIGHHGNLLVYGPGGYQFMDFLRVGTPLTILVALVVTWLAPLLWPR